MIYDLVLGCGFLCWHLFRKKKQYPSLKQSLGLDIPETKGRPVLWVHAVSVGEVKAVSSLAQKLKGNRFLLVTTQSVTGQEEAKRSIPQADAVCPLPLDFSWVMNKWAKKLKPELLVLVEGDFWYHMLRAVKRCGGKTVLVSGKLSDTSARRFGWVKWLSRKLFSQLDLVLVQSDVHKQRFAPFVEPHKLHVTGNIKFDAVPEARADVALPKHNFPIAVTCTHPGEEQELLDALAHINATIYLAPRHPERFPLVAELLIAKKIPFVRWSKLSEATGNEKVILIDAMGQLPLVYRHCRLAILAGSFSSKIGGHNVLEPCLYGCPVLFGPHMQHQTELMNYVVAAGAGKQVRGEGLADEVSAFRQKPETMRTAAAELKNQRGQVLERTMCRIQSS